MQTYSKFRPTAFDTHIAFDDDREQWLMVPVSRTWDSDELEESNFEQALEMLGGEGDDVEVHRYGHWGPGWFEIIIVRPGSKAAEIAEEIESALENYPVLNEEDFSRREWESYQEQWQNYGYKDFVEKLKKDFELSYATVNFLEDCSIESMQEFFQEGCHSGEYYSVDSGGTYINFRAFDCSRQELAKFLWSQHKIRS